MRCFAALMVLAIHTVAIPFPVNFGIITPFLAKYGPAGVDIFFVISGFIITTVAYYSGQKLTETNRLTLVREFIIKRIIRIYPIYWVVFIASLLLSPWVWLSPAFMPNYNDFGMFFLFERQNNTVMAAWTLTFELYFYFIVSLAFLIFPRNIFLGVAIWSVSTLAAILYFTFTQNPLVNQLPFIPILLEFMLGSLLAFLIQRKITAFPVSALAIGLLWFFVGAKINSNGGNWDFWYRTLCFGPAAALIIYGFMGLELNKGWVFHRYYQLIGDASYSIYIWHQLVIYSMMTVALDLGLFAHVPAYLFAIIWALAAFCWGMFFYFAIEKKILVFLGRVLIDNFRKRFSSSSTAEKLLNYGFLACLYITVLVSYSIYNYTKQPLPTETHILADWSQPTDIDNNKYFNQSSQLSQPAVLKLSRSHYLRTLKITMKSENAGTIYISYRKKGWLSESWYNFEKNGVVYVPIPGTIDNQSINFVHNPNQNYELAKIEILGP